MIGAGQITRNSHLPAAMGNPRANVIAMVDPAPERARALADAFGLRPKVGVRVEEVLSDIDAAVIATPNSTHAELAIQCLSAGKSVLIEKPLTTRYEDAEAILAAAEHSGAIVAVGYVTRFRESVVLLKELLERRHFGEVRRFTNQFGTAGGWSPVSGYNLDPSIAGGGVLIVTGTHFLDRMLYWWGYPAVATMTADSAKGPEANCRCHFAFEPGSLTGLALYSKTTSLVGGSVIDTEAGFVLIGEDDDSPLRLRPHDAPELELELRRRGEPLFPPGVDSFDLQMDDFVAACLDGRSPRVDGHTGAESVRLIDELYRSCTVTAENWYAAEDAVA